MARTYAQIYLTLWNDPDFKALSRDAQHLYFVMLTHPSLNSCGVLDWRENRLLTFASGWDAEGLRQAAWELGQGRFIAVDPDTDEALVRSFVRHDGILKSPNKTKAMVREHASIASRRIMELVSREVRRAIESEPDLKGSEVASPVAKQFPEPIEEGFVFVPEWFQFGSVSDPQTGGLEKGEGFQIGSPIPSSLIPYPSTDVERGHASAEAAPPTQKRGSRIRADWVPSRSVIDTLSAEWPDYDLKSAHADFVDYWLAKPGAAGLKVDWDATWRRWMRKNAKEAHEKQASRTTRGTTSTTDERVAGWMNLAAQAAQTEPKEISR